MALVGSSFFTVSDRSAARREGSDAEPVVVWLRGEHDVSTDDALCLTLVRAIALDSTALVIDLSGVEFMGASTIGVIVRAREFLGQRSASLTVRSPSAFVRRILAVCGLDDFLGLSRGETDGVAGNAFGPRVAVPPAEQSDGLPRASAGALHPVPAGVGETSA